MIITLITLGKYLEARGKAQTGEAIRALLGLRAKTARIVRGSGAAMEEVEIAVDEVSSRIDILRRTPPEPSTSS